jgi:hypothetical protein
VMNEPNGLFTLDEGNGEHGFSCGLRGFRVDSYFNRENAFFKAWTKRIGFG